MIINMQSGGVVPERIIDADTITPGIENQTLAAGTYLRGELTILGDADLVAENIKKGMDIFGITGTMESHEYGIFVDEYVSGSNTNPQRVTVKLPYLVEYALAAGYASAYYWNNLFSSIKNGITVESCCEYVGKFAFKGWYPQWLKTKAKEIASNGYGQLFAGSTQIKLGYVWIGKECTTIAGSSSSGDAFYNNGSLTKFYCEPTSKPSGWGSYWNYVSSDSAITALWGVSESDFDEIVKGAGY